MSLSLSKNDRRLIPKWRDSKVAIVIGELSDYKEKVINPINISHFNNKLQDWNTHKSLFTALELVSIAHIYGKISDVREAVDFVINSKNNVTKSAYNFVSNSSKEASSISNFSYESLTKDTIIERINELKRCLHTDPRNSILYVDLSRFYSILGENEYAKQNINKALILAKDNRFILRSASRLFAHLDEHDTALKMLHRASNLTSDPWLLSAEVSLNSSIGKRSKFIKKSTSLINDLNFKSLHISELSSSIGTVFFNDGNVKKAKGYFEKSLIYPTDNSYAQAIWVRNSANRLSFQISLRTENIPPLSFEAYALNAREYNDWNNVITNCLYWLDDEPYSSRPALLGSFVASVFLENHKLCEEIVRRSLRSNPHDIILINNLVVSLAEQNKLQEAEIEFRKIKGYIDDEPHNCTLHATQGLLFFKNKNYEMARQYYYDAMKIAANKDNKDDAMLALLHLTREEIYDKTDESHELVKVIENANYQTEVPEVLAMKNKVVETYNKVFKTKIYKDK